MKLQNLLTLPNILWGTKEETIMNEILNSSITQVPQGQFSYAVEKDQKVYLVRDRLGLNKLFYHIDYEKKVLTVSNYLYDLFSLVGSCRSIFSVPAGHYLTIDKESLEKKLVSYYDLSEKVVSKENFQIDVFQREVKDKLEEGLQYIKQEYADHQIMICLSGGLDSTVVVEMAQRVIGDRVSAVTFSYASKATIDKYGSVIVNPEESLFNDPLLSEDFFIASKITRCLGVPFIAVLAKRSLDLTVLDDVIKNGQDWRDFNVHCAWVNHAIASLMIEKYQDEKIVFLTGDLMNEYVADYAPVDYQGMQYYPQPRISGARLRNFFVYGLDSGDRELGIFAKQGYPLIQPYSLLTELYLQVPSDMIENSNCKQQLNKPLLENNKIDDLVSEKKIRSQVGGSDGGTLGLFHDSAITQNVLHDRWKKLFLKDDKGEESTNNIIYAGRYKSQ